MKQKYNTSRGSGGRKTFRSKEFPARWEGTCEKCGNSWKVKTPLCYENNVLVHATCPAGKTFKSLLAEASTTIANDSGVNIPEEIEAAYPYEAGCPDAPEHEDGVACPACGGSYEDETEEGQAKRPVPPKPFVPSTFQQAVFDWAKEGEGNAVVEAVAGSGKTTTIVKMLDIFPSHLRILFVAFNRDIVKELKNRLPKHIRAVTLNGLGFAVVRKYEGFQDMDEDKVSGIMNEFWDITKKETPDPIKRMSNRIKRSAMRKLVGLVKNTLADYNDEKVVLELIDRYHIEVDEQAEAEVIEKLPYVMEKNNADLEYVDYDDQIYLPVVHPALQNMFDKYDFILGDEVQDWNAANIQLVLRHLAPEGRLIAVGDRKQSINGFRGADIHAIPHIIEQTNAITLPLSICYRCPRSHVENIRHLVPQIEAAPDAKEGILKDLKYEEMMELVKEGDMVLCRTNAPLVKPAFACIKKGMKAIIKGKAIGKDLVEYIDRFQVDDLGALDVLMQEHTEKEIERYLNKNKEMMAEQVKERYETIAEIASHCTTVTSLTTRILTLFSDDRIGVVFSSVHRAKGLEAETVFLYRPDLIPHPKAKGEEELIQEDNLDVVARTRSKDTLYTVYGEEK